MKLRIENILVGITILILFIPLSVEKLFVQVDLEPLHGTVHYSDSTDLSWANWADKSWQENQEEIIKNNLAIRPLLVRLQNEIDFRIFDEYHMGDLLIGKEGYYFSLGWAKSRCCENNLNRDTLSTYIKKLKILSNILEQKGKYFKVIVLPSKEEIFADMLPDEYAAENQSNDYHLYTQELIKHQLEHWDLTSFYRQLQDTSNYPIYSKTSVHWTQYGASFALEKLLVDMNTYFSNTMANICLKGKETSKFKKGDGDLEQTLNLLSRLDNSDFVYKNYTIDSSQSSFKPTVLTIGDSFYWGIRSFYVLPKIYSKDSKYLYYYSKSYPQDGPPVNVKDLNIVEEFINSDAIIILNSAHNLEGYPFGLQNDLDRIIEALNQVPDKSDHHDKN